MTTATTTKTTKGQQVLDYLKHHPNADRKAIADAVGCTVQRVGEVLRAAGITTVKPAKADKKAARTERCEHEKKAKSKLGSCKKGCPPVAVAA